MLLNHLILFVLLNPNLASQINGNPDCLFNSPCRLRTWVTASPCITGLLWGIEMSAVKQYCNGYFHNHLITVDIILSFQIQHTVDNSPAPAVARTDDVMTARTVDVIVASADAVVDVSTAEIGNEARVQDAWGRHYLKNLYDNKLSSCWQFWTLYDAHVISL